MKDLIIHHDFNLDLKLYSIPKFFISQIKNDFSNICFQDINLEKNKDTVKIYFGNRIDNNIIQELENLKWIHLGCVGYDSIDLETLKSRNILITNSKGLLTNSMVELALNFITSLSRGMHHVNSLRQKNKLDRKNFDVYFETITNLSNQKVLICGYGEVGLKLAKVLSQLDMDIYTISRSQKSEYKNFSLDDLEDIVSEVHYIINLLPLTNDTEHIFDSRMFSKMNNVNFINLGRGNTVNEMDLLEAIKNKNLAGVGLDVFEREPLSNKSNLLNHENIIITPHIAGLDSKYWDRQLDLFSSNLKQYLTSNYLKMKNTII